MEKKLKYQEWLNERCPEHNFVYRYKVSKSNHVTAARQCTKCNYMPFEQMRKGDVDNFNHLVATGEIKINKDDNNWGLHLEYLEDYKEKYSVELKNIYIDSQFKYKQNYSEYLLSEKWYEIRKKVLKRDNYTCQGCLEKEAEEVHHKNYTHLFDELLFDLISVCKSCHIKIHSKETI